MELKMKLNLMRDPTPLPGTPSEWRMIRMTKKLKKRGTQFSICMKVVTRTDARATYARWRSPIPALGGCLVAIATNGSTSDVLTLPRKRLRMSHLLAKTVKLLYTFISLDFSCLCYFSKIHVAAATHLYLLIKTFYVPGTTENALILECQYYWFDHTYIHSCKVSQTRR